MDKYGPLNHAPSHKATVQYDTNKLDRYDPYELPYVNSAQPGEMNLDIFDKGYRDGPYFNRPGA